MDYQKRLDEVNNYEPGNYFKPDTGFWQVQFLSEGREDKYEEDDRVNEQVVFNVKVCKAPDTNIEAGKEYLWCVGVGKTPVSLYGQIMKYAVETGGKLEGQVIALNVIHDPKKGKNAYTVLPGSLKV